MGFIDKITDNIITFFLTLGISIFVIGLTFLFIVILPTGLTIPEATYGILNIISFLASGLTIAGFGYVLKQFHGKDKKIVESGRLNKQ